MIIDDNYIITYFFVNNKINGNKIKHYRNFTNKTNLDIYNYLINKYNDNPNNVSIVEILNRIKYKIDIRPVCQNCGKPVNYNGNINKGLYAKYCCVKCSNSNKIKIRKEKQTKFKKYGNPNYNNRQKFHNTCLEKYGKYTYTNRNKATQTYLNKLGSITPFHNKNIQNKVKETIKNKYGVDNISQLSWVKKLKEQTCLKKYGKPFYTQTLKYLEKTKQTCLEKYKKEFYVQTDEFKEKSKQTCLKKYGTKYSLQSPIIRNYGKQTCLKKYGNENYNNRNKYIQTCLNLYNVTNTFQLPNSIINKIISCSTPEYHKKLSLILSSDEVLQKIHDTKKKNKTFNTSKPEDKSYELLKEKYPDVIRQYRNELYPFNCDFYIPSLDLYIECNYFWTHGGKLYENNDKDHIILNQWEEKKLHKDMYKSAIYTWTISDVKKYNMAKKNKLNYLMFYKIEELKSFLKEG